MINEKFLTKKVVICEALTTAYAKVKGNIYECVRSGHVLRIESISGMSCNDTEFNRTLINEESAKMLSFQKVNIQIQKSYMQNTQTSLRDPCWLQTISRTSHSVQPSSNPARGWLITNLLIMASDLTKLWEVGIGLRRGFWLTFGTLFEIGVARSTTPLQWEDRQ